METIRVYFSRGDYSGKFVLTCRFFGDFFGVLSWIMLRSSFDLRNGCNLAASSMSFSSEI